MTAWDIDAASARGIIARTVEEMLEFHTAGDEMDTAIQVAASASNSPGIAAALASVYDDYVKLLISNATVRATNACNGTSQAVNWYVQGDLDMATTSQHSASQVPE
ncbi:DUF6507 family protein [Arthrobacter flavus]|uniref:DUF6507 family protein n=1 Tax=Arthrobacter flavus TaxID=95172 RepID=A0ABW4Q4U1_9MICC